MARYELDLQAAILNHEYSYRDYYGELCVQEGTSWGEFWAEEHDELDIPEFGKLSVIETVGGEGQGDHAHVVFKLVDAVGSVTYYKVDGYYSSYDGVDWDGSDLYSVQKREKTITVYE